MTYFNNDSIKSFKSANYTGGKSEPKGNYGKGPTKAGTTGDTVPNPTSKGGKINGGTTVKKPGNPDQVNIGHRMTKGNSCC